MPSHKTTCESCSRLNSTRTWSVFGGNDQNLVRATLVPGETRRHNAATVRRVTTVVDGMELQVGAPPAVAPPATIRVAKQFAVTILAQAMHPAARRLVGMVRHVTMRRAATRHQAVARDEMDRSVTTAPAAMRHPAATTDATMTDATTTDAAHPKVAKQSADQGHSAGTIAPLNRPGGVHERSLPGRL